MWYCSGIEEHTLGYHYNKWKIEDYVCYVGGLPFKRTMPFQYKAPFSPSDVIEIYMRPARIVENGKQVTKQAMSDSELIEFDEVGTLEAFNTDGLRTLLTLKNIKSMKEKTLRYPGHIDLMKVFCESGFFSNTPVKVGNNNITPVELSSKLLFPIWNLKMAKKSLLNESVYKGKKRTSLSLTLQSF